MSGHRALPLAAAAMIGMIAGSHSPPPPEVLSRNQKRSRTRRALMARKLDELLALPKHKRQRNWENDVASLNAALYGGRLGRRMSRRNLSHWGKCGRLQRLAKWAPTRRDRKRPIVEKAPGDVIARLTKRVALFYGTGAKAATRALICAEHGVPNTGRQWRKIRKAIRREVPADA